MLLSITIAAPEPVALEDHRPAGSHFPVDGPVGLGPVPEAAVVPVGRDPAIGYDSYGPDVVVVIIVHGDAPLSAGVYRCIPHDTTDGLADGEFEGAWLLRLDSATPPAGLGFPPMELCTNIHTPHQRALALWSVAVSPLIGCMMVFIHEVFVEVGPIPVGGQNRTLRGMTPVECAIDGWS